VLHLHDAVPGDPGDNYSLLWNLWWMRHVLATPGLAYFHTTYLFHPFGTNIVNHPNTALPAFVAATLLKPASIVTAQNLLLLAYVFANMAAMYALVWDISRHRRAALFGAVTFGLSPYLAVHLLGHFDLVAAWVLPAFALALRRAVRGSKAAAIAAGLVLAATAYVAYYYVVYEVFFAMAYLAAGAGPIGLSRARMPQPITVRWLRALCLLGAIASAGIAAMILVTGGRSFEAGAIQVSATKPQNALTATWLCVIGLLACDWRVALIVDSTRRARARRSAEVAWRLGAVFLAGAAPLLWQAAGLLARGGYVTHEYGWRSIPRGVDLLAPLLGHPLHPLMAAASLPAYAALHQDFVEAIAWIGVVPAALLIVSRQPRVGGPGGEMSAWRAVAIAFTIFALGPFLTVGGFDTGLKLPEILMRYVPIAANARMPGRAMVGVYMAIGVLIATSLSGATGRLRSPAVQWLLIALVAFEYWDAPIRLTSLDHPAVYRALAAAAPGAVCEVPFGIGDGLSVGLGSQERRVLFYATLHEHPLAGGFVGRMPADAAERYGRNPMTATLLRLSGGAAAPTVVDGESKTSGHVVDPMPCRYLIVDRASSSAALRAYVAQLPTDHLASDEKRDLYRLR
jgi:hypothetical protein